MKDFISALEKMMKEEVEGDKNYQKLSKLLESLGETWWADQIWKMANEEHSHKGMLKMLIGDMKRSFGRKLKGR